MHRFQPTTKQILAATAIALSVLATAGTATAGPIEDKYARLGGASGPLGPPLSGIVSESTARGTVQYQKFTRGVIILHKPLGCWEIHGPIYQKWQAVGGASRLGYPISDQTAVGDGRGQYNNFERGFIYWTQRTGAHVVDGAVGEKWASLRFQRYGYPTSDTTATPDGRGRYSEFEEYHSIYWTAQTGAHSVTYGFRGAWLREGGGQGSLGYPISEERWVRPGDGFLNPPDGRRGRVQYFEHGRITLVPDGIGYNVFVDTIDPI